MKLKIKKKKKNNKGGQMPIKGTLRFENDKSIMRPKKRPNLLVIIISSLIFGFLGGIIAIYSLGQTPNIKESKLGQTVTQEKNVKVTEESGTIDSVKKVEPSVISIVATSEVQDIFGYVTERKSGGTGFIITSDGLILTNKHVVSDSSADYTVFTYDGKSYQARVKSKDPFNDLAVIEIKAKNLPVVELGDSDVLQAGQRVIAIGNALGFQNTVTAGVISAKERTIEAGDATGSNASLLEGLLQTDAAINAGNSGGPLINLAGQVVGINTAVVEKGTAEGIGFAIPINIAKSAIESVKKTGEIIRPMIGIRYVTITKEIAAQNKLPAENGSLISSDQPGTSAVLPGSPADIAGLKAGDIITEINEEKIDENHSLSRLIQQYQPGDEIEISFLRNSKEEKVKLKLVEYKE